MTLLRTGALLAAGLFLVPTLVLAQTPQEIEELGLDQASPDILIAAPARSGTSLRTLGDVLLVPDSGGNRLIVLDAETGDLIDENFITNIPGGVQKHAILNFDGDGIFIAVQSGAAGNVVYEYTLDGEFLGIFAPKDGANTDIMQNIAGMAIDPSGTQLWVTVGQGTNAGAIVAFDTGGNYVGNFIEPAVSPFSRPWALVIRDNDVLVSSQSPNGIYRFNPDGSFVEQWNQTPISWPQQFAPASEGNILAAGWDGASGIREYDSNGTQLAYYSVVSQTRGVYELPNGNLLVANGPTGGGVHEITRNNTLVRTIVSGNMQYIEHIGVSNLSFTPSTLEGEVLEGATGMGSFTMHNNTDAAIDYEFASLPAFISQISPTMGTLAAEGEVEVSVTFDGTVGGGVHHGVIVVETDEDDNGTYEYQVVLTVIGDHDCVIEPDPIAFDAVIIGFDDSMEVTLTNEGTGPCPVVSVSSDQADFTADLDVPVTLQPGESVAFDVTFAPASVGEISGWLTLAVDDGADVVTALEGVGLAPPVMAVEPETLHFAMGPDATASQSIALSNLGIEGAADLEFSVSVVASRQAAQVVPAEPSVRTRQTAHSDGSLLSIRASGSYVELGEGATTIFGPRDEITITHSASTTIPQTPSPIGCAFWEANPPHAVDNAYWRVFDLSQFDIEGQFTVKSVDVGVWMNHTTNPPLTTVRLHTLDGAVSTDNMTLAAEAPLQITAAHHLSLARAEFGDEAVFEANEVLVVEWSIPTGAAGAPYAGHHTLAGQNAAGQTGPTYLSTSGCGGLPQPVTLASIGFPDAHWVLLVNGTAGPAMITVEPMEGWVAAGSSQQLEVTVDTQDLEFGTYGFELLIQTNDPETPVHVVDVTVEVEPVSAEEGTGALEFALEANYPNPFSDQTTIAYSLATSGPVRIAVYDVAGRRVATLVDAEMEAGRHTATWDAHGIAAGVYFYRIQAGSFTQTHRAVIVR